MPTSTFLRAATMLAVILGIGLEASAQRWRYGYGGYRNYGWGNPYGGSTVAGSYAHGLADVVRARGHALKDTAEAYSEYQEGLSKEMDNRYKWTQTYFAMREANREARAKEKLPTPTYEQLVRYAHAGAPDPLSPTDVDPESGEIRWPAALRIEPFAQQREILENIFHDRAISGGQVSVQQYQEVQATTDAMQATLKQFVKDFDPNTYVRAKKFLQSMAYDVRLN